MAILHQKLQQTGIVALTAVSGMGGVGKTELATQYARQNEAAYPGGICWLTARESNLAAAIVQFALLNMRLTVPQQDLRGNLLSLTEQVEWCWQHWKPQDGLVLVVLDDVTDLESCRDFLPKNNRFRVLMTTRLRNLDSNIEEISLDVLSHKEALQLLKALVGEKQVQRELETAKELCEWLGYLPLGLELVGRYVAKKPPNWTFKKMLERLKHQRLEDEAMNPKLQKTLSTAQQGVKAAFELSWLELDEMTQHTGELLSLFAPSIFAWESVESAANLLNWAYTDIDKANEQLYQHHLIQWVEDPEKQNCWKIHLLIREFLKLKLTASEQADKLKRSFAETFVTIAQKIPNSPNLELINSVKDAIPHLAEVAENLTASVSDNNFIWVFVGLSSFYEGQGLYALAEPWSKQCVSVVQTRLGENHPYVADSYNNLALLYYLQGRYSEAEHLQKKALELRQRLLGEDHPDVAASYNNLGLLYRAQGRYSEAELLYKKALELRQRLLGEDHPSVATSYNNLAYLYNDQGRYTDAEPLYIQALQIAELSLGANHPNTITIRKNLKILRDNYA